MPTKISNVKLGHKATSPAAQGAGNPVSQHVAQDPNVPWTEPEADDDGAEVVVQQPAPGANAGPVAAAPTHVVAEVKATKTKTQKAQGGAVVSQEHDQQVLAQLIVPRVHGVVGLSMGRKWSDGNYGSMEISLFLSVPHDPEKRDEALKDAYAWVNTNLSAMLAGAGQAPSS